MAKVHKIWPQCVTFQANLQIGLDQQKIFIAQGIAQ